MGPSGRLPPQFRICEKMEILSNSASEDHHVICNLNMETWAEKANVVGLLASQCRCLNSRMRVSTHCARHLRRHQKKVGSMRRCQPVQTPSGEHCRVGGKWKVISS
ncbi:hypothetical protein M758_4G105300 [Ceratodon purpureus]|nr:hypothetical protein M758_4G105300 [Ceratodon purpureus]